MRALLCLLCLAGLLAPRHADKAESLCASGNPRWHAFVERTQRFCFQYPSLYQSRANAVEPGRTVWANALLLARLESGEMRRATGQDRTGASITVWFSKAAFSLQRLIKEAPTGVTEPPLPIHFGANIFYRYGPGGGGVSYPDVYYFNLRGQTLKLEFDGPYSGETKSPAAKTKAIETKVLASFRTF